MKFPDLADGDRVVIEMTDCHRTFFDMGPHPIEVAIAGGVTEKSFVANGKRYSRNNGTAVGPPGWCRLSARPYTEGIEDEIAARKKPKQPTPAQETTP